MNNSPPQAIAFIRAESGEWEPWPPDTLPLPPDPTNFPLRPCQNGHPACAEWGGVHIRALRFADGRVWDALGGWV